MSERLPTIWLNVTTSANWQRPPVGIVRVERSMCEELANLYGSRFKKCVWQEARFVEWVQRQESVDSHQVVDIGVARSQEKVQLVLPMIFPILPRKQALRAVGQGLLSLMPGRLRSYFNHFLYRVRPMIGRVLASEQTSCLIAWLRRPVSAYPMTTQVAMSKRSDSSESKGCFLPGDVLISIGLDWDNSFSKHFFELRKHRGVKIVTCCYDLIPVLYPQYCVSDVARKFLSYFLDLADGSDLILCISKQSEIDLNEMLHRTGGARPPTHVFPLGDNVPLSADENISLEVQAICQKSFILFVSTIERRKNHEVLYRAYHLLCSQGKRAHLPKLVFVGMQGWGVDELMKDIELDPQTEGLIARLNHVSDAELRALYGAARFCVFPSLYEGWGLPVGEALSLGKAVISSDRGSLPEVGGDVVRYVDPWSPQDWADEIYKMETDDAWRSSWEKKVKKQYHSRKWSDAAISVKNAIELIAK